MQSQNNTQASWYCQCLTFMQCCHLNPPQVETGCLHIKLNTKISLCFYFHHRCQVQTPAMWRRRVRISCQVKRKCTWIIVINSLNRSLESACPTVSCSDECELQKTKSPLYPDGIFLAELVNVCSNDEDEEEEGADKWTSAPRQVIISVSGVLTFL